MSDESRPQTGPRLNWTTPILVLVLIGMGIVTTGLLSQRVLERKAAELRLDSEMGRAAAAEADLRAEIESLKRAAAQREAQFSARESELAQREGAIEGREDAATERTQASFQGLLIQQQLVKTLEALKASLPDMTPEVERITREHAQLGAERQRLEKENAELRLKLRSANPLETR